MSKRAKFEREEVVEKAKDLYWAKGYHGTSMRALQEAIDMRPGSIYATFGSKDGLFKEAIQQYARESGQLLRAKMQSADSNIAGLKQFIRALIIEKREGAPSGMCMLVKSVAELTETDNPELLDIAKQLLADVERTLKGIIQDAIDNGEINKGKDPLELARFLQVQIIGLRTFARATNEISVVDKFIDDIFENPLFK